MEYVKWIISHLYNFISGIIAVLFGYLSPIEGIIQVMVITILIDMFFGCIASYKRGEGISSRKLWRTIYKMLYSILIVSLMFSIDKEMCQIPLHKTIAWLITGFEFWSILENLSEITKLKIFNVLKKLMTDKVKKETGIDIGEK